MIDASLAYLKERQKELPKTSELTRLLHDMKRQHHNRLLFLQSWTTGTSGEVHKAFNAISHEVLQIERSVAIALRNDGRINDIVLRRLEHELDLSQARIDTH